MKTSFFPKIILICLAMLMRANMSYAQQDLEGTYFYYSDKKNAYEDIELNNDGSCKFSATYGEVWAQICALGTWKHWNDTLELTLQDCRVRLNVELGLNMKWDPTDFPVYTKRYLIKGKTLIGPIRKRRFNVFPDRRMRIYEFLLTHSEQIENTRSEVGHFDYEELQADMQINCH